MSGEKTEKAIQTDVVQEYYQLSNKGQLKFVVGEADREWDEMESTVEKFRFQQELIGPCGLCPVGAREEEQPAGAGKVAEKAFKKGYNVAARVLFILGNAIGT